MLHSCIRGEWPPTEKLISYRPIQDNGCHISQGRRKQFRSGKAGQPGGVAAPLVRMHRLRHKHLLLVMVVTVITRTTVASCYRYLRSYSSLKGPGNEASTTVHSSIYSMLPTVSL